MDKRQLEPLEIAFHSSIVPSKVTLVKLSQYLNAEEPIEVTELEMTAARMVVKPLNIFEGMYFPPKTIVWILDTHKKGLYGII